MSLFYFDLKRKLRRFLAVIIPQIDVSIGKKAKRIADLSYHPFPLCGLGWLALFLTHFTLLSVGAR